MSEDFTNWADILGDDSSKKQERAKESRAGARKRLQETMQDSRKAANAATGKKHADHGSYVQRTFRIPPEHDRALAELAEQFESRAALERWCVGRGLKAILEDGESPEMETRTVKRLDVWRP